MLTRLFSMDNDVWNEHGDFFKKEQNAHRGISMRSLQHSNSPSPSDAPCPRSRVPWHRPHPSAQKLHGSDQIPEPSHRPLGLRTCAERLDAHSEG